MADADFPTKRRTKCGEFRGVSFFGKQATRKDGLRPWCKRCTNSAMSAKRIAEWDKVLERERVRYHLHPEKQIARRAKYKLENHEKKKSASLNYRRKNKEKANAVSRQWAKDNPERHRAHRAKRRAMEICATPKWADKEEILRIYQQARDLEKITGRLMHVDHVVPLQSEIVCGLHVAENLEILTDSENRRKGNRHWPDMP